jgi:probable HAF family extracellular repeat protein
MMKLLKRSLMLAATTLAGSVQAGSMTDLGSLGGTWSAASGVSADGLVVVGTSSNPDGWSRAFKWTAGTGMTDLGSLGGVHASATAASADGSVIVGIGNDITETARAFRWTSASGMTDLGDLGAAYASSSGVSADGSVVVGTSGNSLFEARAFRWTAATGMTNLGTLGGNFSSAYGVSGDGSTVIGDSNDLSGDYLAFRWTAATGMTSLGTLGGNNSRATAASDNGSVIVGFSRIDTGSRRAFRWTAATGMTNLGTLGGDFSAANAVTPDGSVIVGQAAMAGGARRAFRWTADSGMINLGTLGDVDSEATGVSEDGSIIVGYAGNEDNTRAFLYTNNEMLDVQDWLGSVGGVCSMLSMSLELHRSSMEGAHHRPLAELGRGKSYWVTGDVAGSSRSRDLNTRSGEAGVTFEPWTNVLVGIGAGYGRQDQRLLNDGSAATFGQYLLGELDFLLADGGILSVVVSSGDWENETDRGYVTGGGVDYSHGETDIKSSAFRLRYDTPTLTRALGADVKAYASYGHSRARADGYAETGGSFAGSFDQLTQTAKEGRLGLAATRTLGEKFRGRLSAEWIRRFDRDQASITATEINSGLNLTLPGAPVVRDQARFGFDLDYLMDAQTTLSFTTHAAGRGESADVSGAISMRRAF